MRNIAKAQGVDDLSRVQLPFDPDRQTFPAMFIQDVERSERPAIVGSVVYEVVRPDMVAILRAQIPPFLMGITQPALNILLANVTCRKALLSVPMHHRGAKTCDVPLQLP